MVASKYISLITASLLFVVGMAWNEAISSFFESYLGKSDSVTGRFIYAFIITSLLIIFQFSLS
jgi:hypothetical protein